MKRILVILAIISVILLCGCAQQQEQQIANPASVFCINNSGISEIRSDENGSQTGYCKFNNGKECEEWAYFRGECKLDKCETCPMLSSPSPDFCKGGNMIPGETNECGCVSPPRCEMPEVGDVSLQNISKLTVADVNRLLGKDSSAAQTGKFLVHFPWTNGESCAFVTGFHDENCVDFANCDKKNIEVVAAADGKVILSTHSHPNSFNTYSPVKTNNPEDMGNFAIIQHNEDTYSVYMHFQQETTPPIKAGDYVKAGQRIGYQGDTGWSHGVHLHFCVVDVSIFPKPSFIAKPLESWGFIELDGSNKLILEQKYESQNG